MQMNQRLFARGEYPKPEGFPQGFRQTAEERLETSRDLGEQAYVCYNLGLFVRIVEKEPRGAIRFFERCERLAKNAGLRELMFDAWRQRFSSLHAILMDRVRDALIHLSKECDQMLGSDESLEIEEALRNDGDVDGLALFYSAITQFELTRQFLALAIYPTTLSKEVNSFRLKTAERLAGLSDVLDKDFVDMVEAEATEKPRAHFTSSMDMVSDLVGLLGIMHSNRPSLNLD